MPDVQLIIFDCDGVLVDSERISNGVLAQMLTAEGLQTNLAEARRDYQGLLLDDVVSVAQGRLGRPLSSGWLARYELERAEAFARELRPVPGATEVLRVVAAAGLQVCVASQGKLEKTRFTLGLTGLADLLDPGAIFSAELVARGKPYPDLFLHAAETMGSQPAHCVVVEDSPIGVNAAVAAGMRVFAYSADSDEIALRAAGAQTFSSMAELPGLLGLR